MSRQKIHIISPGPILHGSVSTVSMPCGKENCSCKAEPPISHGPYYRWTGIIDKTQTTRTISQEIAKECERRIRNYRLLVNKFEKLKKKSLENAPWIKIKK